MKTTVLFVLLTALALQAQDTPPSTADATNREAELRRALRAMTEGNTNGRPPGAISPLRGLPRPAVNPAAPVPAPTVTPPPTVPAVPTDPATATPAPLTPQPARSAVANPLPPPPAPPEQPLVGASTIDWTSATLDQVLKIYSEFVGRTVIRPANLALAQPIVLKNQTALTKTELISMLDAVLAINGIAVINIGDKFVKVVPAQNANAAGAAIKTNDSSSLGELGGYTTHVVQLKYAKPSEMVQILTPFASAGMAAPIHPIEGSGILVLRDNTENVKRMLEMIERVDTAIPSEFESKVIPIKFAKAEEIASALNSLSSGGGGGSIGGGSSGSGARGAGQRPGIGGRSGYNGGGVNNPLGGSQLNQPITPGGTQGVGTPSGGGTFSDRLRNLVQRASASGDLTIIGQTKIIADQRSNSLLIFAMHQDMVMIQDIIDKLDIVLPQVLIETIIMDVSLDSSWAFGVAAGQHPTTSGKYTGGGVYNNPSSSSPLDTLNQFFQTAATNLAGNSFPSSSGLSYFGRYNPDFDVTVQAVASDGRVNVIQKPRIQTSHATPANIFVGSTVPYVSSVYYGGGYAGGPSSSFQQLQVGIGLQVTPYINQDGLVLMQIDQTIDEISGSTDITGVGAVPNTTHRTLSAEVAVRDRDTIMLGGFIRNSQTKSKSGVPLLKDIPLLGALFSSRSDSKERKELIVLMRPTVLRTPALAAAEVYEQKKLMPGIRAAEEENRKMEELGAIDKIDKKERKKRAAREPEPGSFTADELKLFSTDPRTNAPATFQ